MYLIQLQDLKEQERKILDSFVPYFFTCIELFSELLTNALDWTPCHASSSELIC
jgi:hypothetical protein